MTNNISPFISANQTIKALHDKDEFMTPLSMSYRCKPAEVFKLAINETLIGSFTISDLQFEAFHNTTDKAFDSGMLSFYIVRLISH